MLQACRRRWRAAPAADRTSAASSAPGIPGSPKRALYSISFGPSAVIIRPANSTPVNGVPRFGHAAHGRADDLVHHAARSSSASSPAPANRRPCRRCWGRCRRRRRACDPARWRAPAHVVPSHEREEARLLACHEFLDHDLGAGRAERAGEAGVDRRVGLVDGHRDDDALAGGEAVGLDHDRRAAARRDRPWPAPASVKRP